MTGALADALRAARLVARAPALGGLALRGPGDAREAVLAALRAALPPGAPVRRVPAHVDDDALLGGLDIAATLHAGRPVTRRGLLAEADGGLVLLPMAERLPDPTAAIIAAAIDAGEVDGAASRFVTVLLDDGLEPDERPPSALLERIACHVDLTGDGDSCSSTRSGRHPERVSAIVAPDTPDAAFDHPSASDEVMAAIATTACALGIASARAPLFALRAARAAARDAGRDVVADDDVALAARLVLAPRATRSPPPPDAEQEPPSPPAADQHDDDERQGDPPPLDDIVLAAAIAALPADVLARLAIGAPPRAGGRAYGAGARRKAPAHGRPLAARPGLPRGGRRLALIDTLRAAAPWQRLRDRDGGRVRIRRDDLRVRRHEARARACTIFAVDASGSSALARLCEAKGAVELLLSQAYVSRAEVALLAFRGAGAEVLLPPTRSLTRARRALAELPGGGGTPLAAGLDAARRLAEVARARGRTPLLVVLTDGRGNVAASGAPDRRAAEADALAAARAIAEARVSAAFVDISPRPRPEGVRLAEAMRARYLPLPRADAAALHAAIAAAGA